MTDEERAKMHQQARYAAADYSYGDNTTNPGRVMEVRKAPRGEER